MLIPGVKTDAMGAALVIVAAIVEKLMRKKVRTSG